MARKDMRIAEHMADASESGIVPLFGFLLLALIIIAIISLVF